MEQATYVEARAEPKEPLTFEAFLQQYDDTHAEWVNGEAIPKMPVSVKHQDTSMFLLSLLINWLAYHNLGKVYHPPLLVKLPLPEGKEVAREPDIVVILNTNPGRFAEQYFDGAPDLIVEIVSPASRQTDRHVKYAEYEAAGVSEYWVLDPDRGYAEFFQRDEGGYIGRCSVVRRGCIAVVCWRVSGWRWVGCGSDHPCGKFSSR
jgi:Uma2 family endonuclease